MSRTARILSLSLVIAALGALPSAGEAKTAKRLFSAKSTPSQLAPEPLGSYAKGCLAGAEQLPETAPGWQAMRLSRNRNWGHPSAIRFIERLSVEVQDVGWPGLYIGDISQPRGGPMRSGHRSHQMGLDIDIWLKKPSGKTLSRRARERISSDVVVSGSSVNSKWTREHHGVLKKAAQDPIVARIFVNSAIKQELCWAEPRDVDRSWLRKIRPWYGHDAHFHVRLTCPAGALDCQNQDPIPAGDGCDATLAWWFSDEARNPKPKPGAKKKPRRAIMLADLPQTCAAVLRK
ncbi:MAG: penicillin-insensitive murein endopeptidase [Pseudomonadota bacterium]